MLALVLAMAVSQTPNTSPSASDYYRSALRATESLPTPTQASYRAHIVSRGMRFSLTPYGEDLQPIVSFGDAGGSPIDLRGPYRFSSGTVTMRQDTKTYYVRVPMFDPTWGGIAQWMRYGFYGPTDDEARAMANRIPISTPKPPDLHTIAVIRAIAPSAYRISDGGAALCHDGSPGHKLVMQAIRNPEKNPLTGVVVDVKSLRLCTMDFRLGANSALSFTGSFELHLNSVGPYWLVTDGDADFAIRALGISAEHSHIGFTYSDFTFPSDMRG